MTLVAFSLRTGEIMNTQKSRYFQAPWKNLQVDRNFLCVAGDNGICFVKLQRGQTRIDFQREDFNNCLVHFAKEANKAYFISPGPKPALTRFDSSDFSVDFRASLGSMSQVRFISDTTLLGVYLDARLAGFSGFEYSADQAGANEIWSILQVHCDALKRAKSFKRNRGMAEIVRSNVPVFRLKYGRKVLDQEVLIFVLRNAKVYVVEYRSRLEGETLSVEIKSSRELFEDLKMNRHIKTLVNLDVEFKTTLVTEAKESKPANKSKTETEHIQLNSFRQDSHEDSQCEIKGAMNVKHTLRTG